MSDGDDPRDLTSEEAELVPQYFENVYYSQKYKDYNAQWRGVFISTPALNAPWCWSASGKEISPEDYKEAYPGIDRVQNVNLLDLVGQYHHRDVYWSLKSHAWKYFNHLEVTFSDSEGSDQEPDAPVPPPEHDSDDEQAEVSQLIESATRTVTSVAAKFSSSPQTPQALPGALPETPQPSSSRQVLPTPAATVTVSRPVLPPRSPERLQVPQLPRPQSPTLAHFPPLPAAPQTPQSSTSRGKAPQRSAARVPQASTSQVPVHVPQPAVVQAAPVQVPPVRVPPILPVMAANPSPKILGSAPEPYDGKPEKADAFLNNLGNYYFLNDTIFDTSAKKVSTALTYFKMGTPAGEWARDKQATALAVTPPAYGTWDNFKDEFKKHFVPAHSELEATNFMYTSRMGMRPFNEWYQEWSTHASRSGANDETKMYAFRQAIPQALHTKIIGVSPPPTTLDDLVRLARDFDRQYRLYTHTNPRPQRGTRNRAMIAEGSDTQVNATSTSTSTRPQVNMGKLSKEEKDRRFREKLCFYCGKPGHNAKNCRIKQSGRQTTRPSNRQDFRARATVTQEESYEEAPEEHPAQIAAISRPQFLVPGQQVPAINEDF